MWAYRGLAARVGTSEGTPLGRPAGAQGDPAQGLQSNRA